MKKENLYYNPETWGLEQIAHLELAGGYEFDTYVAWKNAEGEIFWAHDSGCSCPIPFQDYKEIKELSIIRDYSGWDELHRELGSRVIGGGYSAENFQEFLSSVREHWNAWSRKRNRIT